MTETRHNDPVSIPISFLRECLEYDHETGIVRWRQRPASYFPTTKGAAQWNGAFAGKEAGKKGRYPRVHIKFEGKTYCIGLHRVAWAMETGAWPTEEIDHRNRDNSDNRFCNLREATRGLNSQNRAKPKNNTSGFLGVRFEKRRNNWIAQISVNRKTFHLGTFNSPEAASAAYEKARRELHEFRPEAA